MIGRLFPSSALIAMHNSASTLIVPMRVGMHPVTLRVTNGTDCGFGEPGA